ncbi:MAG: FtsX-like permease family protein [Caldilineaceae bacterium]
MKIGMFFLVALENMVQNKLRTSLTLLGLIVGISSVLLMTGLGRGYQQVNSEMMSRLLPNKLTLRRGFSRSSNTSSLTLRDAELLRGSIGHSAIMAVAPSIQLTDLEIKGFDTSGQRPRLIATTADYGQTEALSFVEGRFFTAEETADRELLLVINEAFRTAITTSAGEVPTTVYIANKRFVIIGVVADVNVRGGAGFPQAYFPITLLPRPLYSANVNLEQGSPVLDEINVLTTDVESIDQAQQEIEMLLRLSHKLTRAQPNDFSINADSNFLNVVQDSSRIFTMVLGGIGAISLVVGGIGIMNIMLATITERTREIGIRKAVGARNTDILFQFLMEAITICLCGALLGVGLSYGLSILIVNLVQETSMSNMRILIDLESVLIACLCGVAAGVLFGLYPAMRAMRLNPIKALQTE